MPRDPDTGLHISMRLLLGIVAGLLVSDMLKVSVKTFIVSRPLSGADAQSLLTVLAAMVFLFRVVVDNVLYYNDPDARTMTPAFQRRVFLILIDLMSYAVCYHIVAKLEPGTPVKPVTAATIRIVVADMAIVELLQSICCFVAAWCLPLSHHDRKDRFLQLNRWWKLSLVSCLLAFIAWLALLSEGSRLTPWPGAIALSFSLASALIYLKWMGRLRYLGPCENWYGV